MNILIIPAFFQTKEKPTQGSFFMDQALALKKAGHNVIILYADTYSVKCIKDWLDYREDNVEVTNGIKIYRKKVFCPLKHGIDIIHAHCCVWAGYAAMKLSEKTGIPYVITEHATLFKLNADKISNSNNKCIKETFGKAAKVICVSGEFKNLIAKYRDKADIEVIGNVVDCGLFKPSGSDEKHKNITFLTICYMETQDQLYKKGIDILLKAWKKVIGKYPNARLIVGGGGHARHKVLEWCKEYNIEDSVEMTGALNRTQVAEYMSKCDFFVLPSRYETFGVVYIEAMACGKPVIAVKNGGPDDFVKDFNGVLIEPENVDELAKAMCTMIDNRAKYNAEIISEYINQNYSSVSIADKLNNIYSTVLDSKI
jgi:glycosyltransferase involved in cell wall biosynthesis